MPCIWFFVKESLGLGICQKAAGNEIFAIELGIFLLGLG